MEVIFVYVEETYLRLPESAGKSEVNILKIKEPGKILCLLRIGTAFVLDRFCAKQFTAAL